MAGWFLGFVELISSALWAPQSIINCNWRFVGAQICGGLFWILELLFFLWCWNWHFLTVRSTLPSPNALGRWFGESVRAAIFSTDVIISIIFSRLNQYLRFPGLWKRLFIYFLSVSWQIHGVTHACQSGTRSWLLDFSIIRYRYLLTLPSLHYLISFHLVFQELHCTVLFVSTNIAL